MIVLVICYACNMAVIPWVECLLANRVAYGIPRLYRGFYPIPVLSFAVVSFVSFLLLVIWSHWSVSRWSVSRWSISRWSVCSLGSFLRAFPHKLEQ